MDITTHERPREKLYKKGASVLSNVELLQVIIGSGNVGMPVAKIARKVDKVLKASGLNVRAGDLTTIQGLGIVKASQIIAGFELANRLLYQQSDEPYKDIDVLADLYADIRNSKKQMLLYAFFDGNGRLIDDNSQIINLKASTARIARKVFGEALAQSTASVLVAVGGETQSLNPALFELSLARDIYATAAMLSISVKSFVLVSSAGEYVIKESHRG
jgi:DNA repair protein RadC